MSQRSYRRLTNFLFFFLFLVFFLLYLLLSGREGERALQGESGQNWANRNLALGDVLVSDVRSGGFIVSEIPVPAATGPDAPGFNQNVNVCRTTVRNVGEAATNVTLSIYGTDHTNSATAQTALINPGLCGGYYYYGTESDPGGKGYASLLGKGDWEITPPEKAHMALYSDLGRWPKTFRLEPGEERHLVLFFWVDEGVLPTVTDLDRNGYSVTVKLVSRGD